jgi:toxin FitB
MSYLLDTNVVSELNKSRPHPTAAAWLGHSGDIHYISVMVIGELHRGIELRRRTDPGRAEELERWATRLAADYADRTLPVTPPIARAWGRLHVVRPLPWTDTLMAATAIVHDLTLVTRNVKDFAGLDVRLLNPFDG